MKDIVFFLWFITTLNVMQAQSPAYKDEEFTSYFRKTSGWTASDATISLPLPNNKALWLFGDTHIDGYRASDNSIPCLFQVRNSMMVQDMHRPWRFTTVLDQTKTGIERTPVKDPANEDLYFWPGHGYSTGDTAIVFWQAYSGKAIEHEGVYYTKIYTPGFTDASGIKQLSRVPLPAGTEYGNAVVVDSVRNYIYIYGQMTDWIINRPLIARIPIGKDISEPWEFYNGSEWKADPTRAAQIMGNLNDYVSASFSVIKLQDKYYMISQDIGFLTCGYGRNIYSWESEHPEGPFTNKKLLYTVEDQYMGEYWVTYNATAHPEFIRNNELLISYNVNGFINNDVKGVTCQSECQDPFNDRRNADGYRPKFIRLPLTFIDTNLNIADRYFPEQRTELGNEKESKFQIYSVSGSLALHVKVSNGFKESANIQVSDLHGRIILKAELTESKTLQIGKSGIFVVSVTTENGTHVQKLRIE